MLTIVICTLNASNYIKGCLDSIVTQKCNNLRIVVIDGMSKDDTLKIIQTYNNDIHFYVSEADAGVYDAMNKSMDIVSEGWVLFMGADDRLMPNVISKLNAVMFDSCPDTDVIYGDVYRPLLNKLYDGKFSPYKLLRRNICQQAVLYPRRFFDYHRFDIQSSINADHLINLRLFNDPRFSKKYVGICICYYEDVMDGLSRNKCDKKFLESRREIALNDGGLGHYFFAMAIDIKQGALNFLKKCLGYK